ncbi:MAG: ATP-binding protein [Treponema sp.]|nr:ATP-binding protein [Treponema sp.]
MVFIKNNRKKRLISPFFIISILIIASLLVVIPLITIYILTQEYDNQIRNETHNVSISIQQTVHSFINGAYNLCYELSLNPYTMNAPASGPNTGISPILANSARRNNFLELIYVTNAGNGWQVSRSEGTLGDRSNRWWFLEIMETKRPFVSRSYISISTGMPCTAVFIPMYNDENDPKVMTHVFGADISLIYMQDLVNEFANMERGMFSFIIDGEGVVIAHPDNKYIETLTNYKTLIRTSTVMDSSGNPLRGSDGNVITEDEDFIISDGFKSVITTVMNGKNGLDIVEYNDTIYYMSYEPITLPGFSDSWSVVTLQNRNVAMNAVSRLFIQVTLIIILVLIIFIVVFFSFQNRLAAESFMLKSMEEAAKKANKAKTAFLSTMSHEIRSPINAISGMTAIGKLAKDTEKKDYAFDKIETASKHLLGIINDVLDMSKIEADKLELSPVSFEFGKMMQAIMDMSNFHIVERRQNLQVNIDKNIPDELIGDEQRLSQVIINLLYNAVKFTPEEGSINLDMQLNKVENDHCHLTVSIKDNGIGIDDDQIERLFWSFEQADASTSRKYGGTGLGLPISKRIVELMGGDIWVESEPGKGSKFTFTVRLKRGEKNESDQKTGNGNENNGGANGEFIDDFSGYSILLAEDIEINREIVLEFLKPTNLNINCAENGAAAVRLFSASPDKYDMIFMDLQMPEMDGLEATRKIRKIEKVLADKNFSDTGNNENMSKQIPIIAMTANVFKDDIEKCLEAGMNGHVGKPVDFNDVIRHLRLYLKK